MVDGTLPYCGTCSESGYNIYTTNLPNYEEISVWINENAVNIQETVDELNVINYVGLYYEVYVNPYVKNLLQSNGSCVTAEYGYVSDTNFTLRNYQYDIDNNSSNIVTGKK